MIFIDKINDFYLLFKTFAQTNPAIAGAASLWGLGAITYFFRDIPRQIWEFVIRQATTVMVVNNSDAVYYFLLKWISDKKMHSFVRQLSLGKTKRHEYEDTVTTSKICMGYGRQWFFFNRHLMSINRVREEANNTVEQKEQIYLTVYGRTHKIFRELFELITKPNEEDDLYLNLYKYHGDYWGLVSQQFRRDIETVALPAENKEKIINHIDKFIKDKSWFIKHGIPWRTGVLLYGPPGTGKTSLAKALCSKFDKNLYLLDLNCISNGKIEDALSSVPRGHIVLIEDIDTAIDKSRENNSSKEPSTNSIGATVSPKPTVDDDDDDEKSFFKISIGAILNAIDGPNSGEGRILIATTNHINKLDPALIREGRFDLKIELDFMKDAEFHSYLKRFFDNIPDLERWHILPNIAPCLVQKLVFENRDNVLNVLSEVAEYELSMEDVLDKTG